MDAGESTGASWRLLALPTFSDDRGKLSLIDLGATLPFDVDRVYYLHDVPAGQVRAGHAHRSNHQAFVALAGACDVTCDDGSRRERVHLDRRDQALVVPAGVWSSRSRRRCNPRLAPYRRACGSPAGS